MKRTKCRLGNMIRISLLIIFGFSFCIGLFMTARILLEQRAADNAYEALRVSGQTATITTNKLSVCSNDDVPEKTDGENIGKGPVINTAEADETGETALVPLVSMDFGPIQEQSPDIKAWIFAEGTPIDYPVVQTDNNDYYLTHLYNGEANSSGSLFLDYRNNSTFTDRNTVIYGHHMQNGSMFYSLKLYKDQSFYDEYPTMQLYTPDGDYLIELVCGTVEDGNYEFVQFDFEDEEDFLSYIESQRSRSTFQSNVEVGPDDRIVSLCTCSYESNNARYMIVGKLLPIMEGQSSIREK